MARNKKKKGKIRSGKDYQMWYQKGMELFNKGLFAEALMQWKRIPKDGGNTDFFHRMAKAYSMIGVDRQREGDLKGAIHYFYQATNYHPNKAIYHYYLGLATHRNGEFSRAASSYKAARRLDQEDRRFNYHYALVLLELGETQEALDILLKNSKGDKVQSDKFFWKSGLIYYFLRTGKEREAMAILKELASYPSQDTTPYLIAGMCYLLIEDFSQAAHCLGRLAQIDTQEMKDNGALSFFLGTINLRNRELAPALEMWEKAYFKGIIPAAQVLKAGYELKSQELFSSGKESAAMKSFQALVALPPEDKIAKKVMLYLHWQRGNSYASEAEFALAIQEWQEALKYQKYNASLIHNIAIAYERIGDLEKANEYWHKTIQNWKAGINDAADLSREGLSLAYRHLARNYQKMNQWGRAIAELRALLKFNPNDLSALKELGEIFFEGGEEEKALPLFKKVYNLNPQDSDTTNWIARAYEAIGFFPEAINYLERSLAMDKKNHFARSLLARLLIIEAGKHLERRRYEKALELLLKGISWELHDYQLYGHLGSIYLGMERTEEASDVFQKALELNPSDPKIAVIIGKIYLSHKIEDTAQWYFKKALEISSLNQLSRTYEEIVCACLTFHSPKLANKYLDDLFSITPADPSDWMDVCGHIMEEHEYPELALEYLRKATKLYPEIPRFYFLLGWAYDDLGEESKAQSSLDQALTMAKANKDQELVEEIEEYLDSWKVDKLLENSFS